jgi:hypothetical protein
MPAYAHDNVSADKLFKENIYLLGYALSKVVDSNYNENGMKSKKSIGGI